jgi:hypothetical protein
MLSIDALNAVYPDARFVMTHRDVGAVLPSVCALYNTLARVLADGLDAHAIGEHNLNTWRTGLERLLAFRDAGNEHRFVDLSFEDVQRDPISQVEYLYAQLGDELTAEARARMTAWWAKSSAERAGPSTYSIDEFGLDARAIKQQFAFYNERFVS